MKNKENPKEKESIDQELNIKNQNENTDNEILTEQEVKVDNKADEDIKKSEELNHDQLESELKEAKDKYLRLVAEFDNFRKRNAKEKNDLIKNAGENLIISLLEIVDDIERAEKQIEESGEKTSIVDGIMLIFNKFKKFILSKGVSEISKIGDEFNPEVHDAIAEVPSENDDQKGKIIDIVQKGYQMNDKIIRHAKVVVGN